MKSSSGKAKARRLQNWVRDKLFDLFPGLSNDDVRTALMGETGADIKLISEKSRSVIPFYFECKNTETLQIWKSLEQAEKGAEKSEFQQIPLLVFHRNNSKTYVAMEWDDFCQVWLNK